MFEGNVLKDKKGPARRLKIYRTLTAADTNRPDCILISPDNILASLHRSLTVENESFNPNVSIISHCNEPPAFPMPDGSHDIAVSLSSIAEKLCQMVFDVSKCLPCPSVPAELIPLDKQNPFEVEHFPYG